MKYGRHNVGGFPPPPWSVGGEVVDVYCGVCLTWCAAWGLIMVGSWLVLILLRLLHAYYHLT